MQDGGEEEETLKLSNVLFVNSFLHLSKISIIIFIVSRDTKNTSIYKLYSQADLEKIKTKCMYRLLACCFSSEK